MDINKAKEVVSIMSTLNYLKTYKNMEKSSHGLCRFIFEDYEHDNSVIIPSQYTDNFRSLLDDIIHELEKKLANI